MQATKEIWNVNTDMAYMLPWVSFGSTFVDIFTLFGNEVFMKKKLYVTLIMAW